MQALLGHGSVVTNAAKVKICVLPILRKCKGWVPVVAVARLLVVPQEWLLHFLGDKQYMVDGEGRWEFALSVGEHWVSATSGQGWIARNLADYESYYAAIEPLLASYPATHWFHTAPAMLQTVPQEQWTEGNAPEPLTPAPPRHPIYGQWS